MAPLRIVAWLTLMAAVCAFASPQAPAPPSQPAPQAPAAPSKDQPPDAQANSAPIVVTPSSGETTPAERAVTLDSAAASAAAKATAAAIEAERKIMANARPLEPPTRVTLIRGLNAEFVYLRRTFPITEKGLTLKHGQLRPEGTELRQLIAEYGIAARPGDKGQITDIQFKGNAIVFELNGGGKKKVKWYQRIQIGGAGGMSPVAPVGDGSMAHGSRLTLEFDKFVPNLTVEQAKQLLAPVFDFSSKSAIQAYTDTLPPKVKAAIDKHQVLVGMNREMVIYAKGRPGQKIRERDETVDYEEWVYGIPPQQVEFIRFVKDEVVQVKTMTVDGHRIVKTEKEVDLAAILHPPVPAEEAAAAQPGAANAGDNAGPAKHPTLRRPGEAAPDTSGNPQGTVPYPHDPNHPLDPTAPPGTPGAPPPQPPKPPA